MPIHYKSPSYARAFCDACFKTRPNLDSNHSQISNKIALMCFNYLILMKYTLTTFRKTRSALFHISEIFISSWCIKYFNLEDAQAYDLYLLIYDGG